MNIVEKIIKFIQRNNQPLMRLDIKPRIPGDILHFIGNNQRESAPAAEYLQGYTWRALKYAREALQQDQVRGHKFVERLSGAGNIPAYWHAAYSAGFSIEELSIIIDEFLDQLAYFDNIFANIWKPQRRILDVRYGLEHALNSLAWLVGMRATREQLNRFLPFCGPAGQDILFDKMVCQLGFERPVASQLLIESLYRHLLKIIDGDVADRTRHVKLAHEKWSRELTTSSTPCKPEQLGYIGCWDLNVALIVMLWEIDDSALRNSPHYPKDLVDHHRHVDNGDQ